MGLQNAACKSRVRGDGPPHHVGEILTKGILFGVFVFALTMLPAPAAVGQDDCGRCERDATSPTGASQFCRFGALRTKIPCIIDEPGSGPPTPPAVSELCDQRDGNVEHCREYFRLEGGENILLYRSYPLMIPNGSLTRAIFIIHGKSRTANNYFTYMLDSARSTGHLGDTLIIAPKFLRESEAGASGAFWGEGWREGDPSNDESEVSSFAVIDRLYQHIRAIFQNIDTIVIAGHSAGGQFVNRYAAAGLGPNLSGPRGRFLVMNPGSYLYIDDRRYLFGEFLSLERPAGEHRTWIDLLVGFVCPGYDRYKYGLKRLNEYTRNVGVDRIIDQLTNRRVTYLAGSLDTRTDDNLDDNCAAQLQGANRLSRWGVYAGYTKRFTDWGNNSRFQVVQGVGHSAERMVNSSEAQAVLFGPAPGTVVTP